MGYFAKTGQPDSPLTTLSIPKGGSKRLRLVGVKARVASDIKLKIDGKFAAAEIHKSPFNGPQGIWTVTVEALALGNSTLTAIYNGKEAARLDLKIFTKVEIVLPPPDSEKGLLTRLLLAESVNPGNNATYDEKESLKAMRWMRLVIKNRLHHSDPSIFGAKKQQGASNYTVFDIVRAKGQFHGFEDYPKLNQNIIVNLSGFLSIANNYNHPMRERYENFIENAMKVASDQGLAGVTDPSKKGLYGWRTKGSSEPGGQFTQFQDLAGQTFYTLK